MNKARLLTPLLLLASMSTVSAITISDYSSVFTGYFAGLESQYADLNWMYGGQGVQGLLLWKDGVTGSYTVSISPTTLNLTHQLRGLYVNPARGEIFWPLDQDSLTQLQALDSSYNSLAISGGLYTSCNAGTGSFIYGQVTHTFSGMTHKLIAGVDIDTANNNYAQTFDVSLHFDGGQVSGFVVDNVIGVANVIGTGLIITCPTPQPSGGGGGGGGAGSGGEPRDNEQEEDKKDEPTEEQEVQIQIINKDVVTEFIPTDDEVDQIVEDTRDGGGPGYTRELVEAYVFARNVGMTTKDTIQEADLYSPVLRKYLAKMMVEYSVKILGKQPAMDRKCIFGDISKESSEIQSYIDMACKLGLMGMRPDGQNPDTIFNPDRIVTREEFATVMSRLIYLGTVKGTEACFYCNHIAQLQADGIIKITHVPGQEELRGYVFIISKRALDILTQQ